jgi:uroporphyrinogen decarboxylase
LSSLSWHPKNHLEVVWGPSSSPPNVQEEDEYKYFIDEYGIKWSMPKKGGLYYDMTNHPLSGSISTQNIENYPWPNPSDPARVQGLREEIESLSQETEYAIVLGGAWGVYLKDLFGSEVVRIFWWI